MADVTVTYKNNKIFETSSTTSETIETGGSYCEEDIILDYKNPLPVLSNPATSSDIRSGYDAGGSSGEVINGSIQNYAGQTQTGTPTPILSNPASAGDIAYGKEALDQNWQKITGSYSPPVLPTLTDPAAVTDVKLGKEYIDGQGTKQTGTYEPPTLPTLTNPASASDIADGKEAIVLDANDQPIKVTGELFDLSPYVISLQNVLKGVTLSTNKIVINAPSATACGGLFQNAVYSQPNTEIVLNTPKSTSYYDMFNNNTTERENLKKVTISSDTSSGNNFMRMFNQCTGLVEVDCDFDFSGTLTVNNVNNVFDFCSALEKVRFVPNTIPWLSNFTISRSPLLTDASIISIANGLKDGVTNQTLTLHATPKARTLEIMGTVSQVTEDGVTYNFFTQDPTGSTTLNAFITQTKGWTLA